MAEPGISSTNNFATWWDLCPKKIGKIACRKSYARQVRILQKERPDVDPHEFLAQAMADYSASKAVADGYIANPLTWLNQGRYYDELEPAVTPVKNVSQMDDTTRAEMARAAQIKAGKRKPRSTAKMNFDLTKAFDFGWEPPAGWWFPIGDPYKQDDIRRSRDASLNTA